MRSIVVAVLALLTPPLLAVSRAADEIYAVSPVYSFQPDGSVAEMAKGDLGELRRKNGFFDGATRTLKLYGARNEEVAVQIVIPFEGEGYSFRANAIGAILAERVTFSVIAYDKVGTKLQPDVILPLDGSVAGLRRFDVPLRIKGLPEPGNKQGMVLMDVWIPRTVPAGLQKGSIAVLQGGEEISALNVEVTVYDFSIPDQPTFRLDYLCYGSPLSELHRDARLDEGGDRDFKTDPAAIKIEHQAYRLSQENRGFLNILPYRSQRGCPTYAYPVKGSGKNATIISFDGFDERFGPVLDGTTSKFGQPPACYKKKDFNSKDAEKILKPVVDRWVAGHVHVAAAYPRVAQYNTPQVLFDDYTGSGEGSSHFGSLAGTCWEGAFLGLEGRVFYKAAFLSPSFVRDSCMFYSGMDLGFAGILASRRVKLLRTSANDYEYLVQARQKSPNAVDALIRKVVRIGAAADPQYRTLSKTVGAYFTNNVEDILTARRLAAGILSGSDPGVTLEGFSSRYSPNGAPDGIVGYD